MSSALSRSHRRRNYGKASLYGSHGPRARFSGWYEIETRAWPADRDRATRRLRLVAPAYSGFPGTRFLQAVTILRGPVAGGENNDLLLGSDGRFVMGITASYRISNGSSRS
jgi:hypothetical protein